MNQETQVDKARVDHWETVWGGMAMPDPMVTDGRAVRDYLARCFDRYFSLIFDRFLNRPTYESSVIELGCGRSIWLPWFAKRFGLEVGGLDYSQTGCHQAEALLARDNIEGDILEGDIFAPPENMLNRFDVVTSFGLVEHFTDTASCISSCAAFAKPGGLIVSEIPNMFGLNGAIVKVINRRVYDMHVPMTREMLVAAHKKAGLEILDSHYLMFANLNVSFLNQKAPQIFQTLVNGSLYAVTRLFWWLETNGLKLPATAFASPYVIVVARKPVKETN
ncbi:MAG: class I SAM-dependent methyltransferase [Alphaproteobacteria bacterium]|jgi:2-polyprenyl-3-methyl-5-hydroxy-6-metoxy-1,4-benzoquinol methylase|nr:class I SAM-dependent methyltransferase [Alphaproteobacteria bacterium]MBT4083527.1 class I SAM-dependent methyltransferase [Alphaproteobacteria bacterium]MBT4546700.1 class I SAM-dependent methyltransferase [Alphaproteobacteria bacterium]MBT7747305.1 class I SAM-dependent methyltransferase [Alphaproteobacteria bacterium]